MRFVAYVLAPRIERVVHHEAMLELLVVVAKVVGEPELDGEQPWRLR